MNRSEERIKVQVGERLRRFRETLGISQESMAKEIGCGKLTIHNYETGKTVPDLLVLSKLKQKYPLDIDGLLEHPEENASQKDLLNVIRLLQTVSDSGIRGIYDNRDKALLALRPYLEKESFTVKIVASSMLGLRRQPEIAGLLKEKIIDDTITFRMLLTHPDKAGLREKQESRGKDTIKGEIFEAIAWLISLLRAEKKLSAEHVQIKFYQGTPTCFVVSTSQMILLNPYPFETEAFNAFCLLAENNGYVYEQYDRFHFEKPWRSDKSVSIKEYFADHPHEISAPQLGYVKDELAAYLKFQKE